MKYPIFIQGRRNHLISPANYSAHADDVELVLNYASVDATKLLEPGVCGEGFKPVCSVDRALLILSTLHNMYTWFI